MSLSKLLLYSLTTYLTIRSHIPPKSLDGQKDVKQDNVLTDSRLWIHLGSKLFLILACAFRQFLPMVFPSRSLADTWLMSDAWDPLELGLYVVTISSVIFRLWCFKVLGDFFTFQVGIRQNHKLVSTGPYRYLLHPSYTGTIFNTIGFLCLSQCPFWISLPYMAYFITMLTSRIKNEEETLANHFKEKWRLHKNGRWRLVPFLY